MNGIQTKIKKQFKITNNSDHNYPFDVIQSMSGKGNCYDNAVADSFFHTLKTELVYHETYRTRTEANPSIFDYIEVFHNCFRKHSALEYKSLGQYEQSTFKQAI